MLALSHCILFCHVWWFSLGTLFLSNESQKRNGSRGEAGRRGTGNSGGREVIVSTNYRRKQSVFSKRNNNYFLKVTSGVGNWGIEGKNSLATAISPSQYTLCLWQWLTPGPIIPGHNHLSLPVHILFVTMVNSGADHPWPQPSHPPSTRSVCNNGNSFLCQGWSSLRFQSYQH